jgi:hypothetical protein
MHKSLPIAFFLSLVQVSACADQIRANADEEIIQQDRAFQVKYSDGSLERYVATYRGFVTQNAHESGGPAVPADFKFVDDRKCHWKINSRIERIVHFAHRSGRQMVYEKLSVRWQIPLTGQGSDFMLLGLRSENCNDAWPRFESDTNNARQLVRSEFSKYIQADTDALKMALSSELNGEVLVERGR